ncbi:hypothetical protein Tco_0476192 [Tanacetum coccineum]
MSSITDIKSALTLKGLKQFFETYHIPDEVHLQIPSPNQTIHEMPTGKIGVYTRFFEYANFRLPLSTFLVNVLKHYRIHISQLSVIGAAKVSHFEILCRVHGFEPTVGLFRCFYVNSKNKGWVSFSKRPGNNVTCYTKPLDSLKSWNDRFFWVDAFACPVSFPWNTSTTASKDPFPKSSHYNAEHYDTLVAYPASFHKYPEPFLCLVGISRRDLFAFIRTTDPTKVRIGERQRGKDKPKLLDTTVGRTVPLLSVAHARAESELDASVDRLFDEEGSVIWSSDHICWCDQALVSVVSKVFFKGEPVPTLPFVTSSVSATPEREEGDHIDSLTGLTSIPLEIRKAMITATTVTATAGAATVVKETVTKPSLFATASSSAGETEPTPDGFSDLTSIDLLVGDIRTVVDPDSDLQKVYVP